MAEHRRDEPAGLGDGPLAIVAVLTEVHYILERVALLSTLRSTAFSLWRGRLAGRDIWIVACYMGKVNAALATQAVIERHHPRAIFVCGSAGSLSADVLPGDLVIGTSVVQHDVGVNLGRRFLPLGVAVGQNGHQRMQQVFTADSRLVAAARLAAAELKSDGKGRPSQIHVGPIATGDQVLFSQERKEWIHETWRALAVDMESGAVAQVAQANGIPWLVLRGISDVADERVGLDLSRLANYVEDGASLGGWMRRQSRRLGYLVSHPTAPAKGRRLIQGVHLAAERAATLTEATIRRL